MPMTVAHKDTFRFCGEWDFFFTKIVIWSLAVKLKMGAISEKRHFIAIKSTQLTLHDVHRAYVYIQWREAIKHAGLVTTKMK